MDPKNRTDDTREEQHDPDGDPPTHSDLGQGEPSEPSVSNAMCPVKENQAENPALSKYDSENNENTADAVLVDRIKKSDRLMIALTAIITAATCAQVYMVWDSGEQTERIVMAAEGIKTSLESSVAIAKQNFETSTEKNDEALKATLSQSQAALDASIMSFRLEQRPWVSLFALRITDPVEVGKKVSVSFRYRNSGRTPALNQYSQSRYYFYPMSTAPPMAKFPIPKEPRSTQFVPPDATLVGSTTSTLNEIPPDDDVRAYLNKRARLFAHIIIRYGDVNGVPHWTTACYYQVFGDPTFLACATGNEMDRNQKEGDPKGPTGE